MSKRLIVANVIMAGLAVFFAVQLARDLGYSRALPPPSAPRAKPAASAPTTAGMPPAEALSSYNVIPVKSVFSPTRGEGPAPDAAAAAPLPPKPVLLGVVVDEPRSLAYLEDPGTKRIFAYRVGDTVAGGRLEVISEDRVVIRRADGKLDVLLSDPAKRPVQPAAGAPPAPGSARPGAQPAPIRAPRVLPGQPFPAAPQQ